MSESDCVVIVFFAVEPSLACSSPDVAAGLSPHVIPPTLTSTPTITFSSSFVPLSNPSCLHLFERDIFSVLFSPMVDQ